MFHKRSGRDSTWPRRSQNMFPKLGPHWTLLFLQVWVAQKMIRKVGQLQITGLKSSCISWKMYFCLPFYMVNPPIRYLKGMYYEYSQAISCSLTSSSHTEPGFTGSANEVKLVCYLHPPPWHPQKNGCWWTILLAYSNIIMIDNIHDNTVNSVKNKNHPWW